MKLNPPPQYSQATAAFFLALVEAVRLLFEAIRPAYQSGITAGTTQTQAGATALTGKVCNVSTVGTASDGVLLPPANPGDVVEVLNTAATNALQVWPSTGDAIDGGSANAVDGNTLAASASRRYYAIDDDNWITLSNG